MSRVTDLIREAKRLNADLGTELEKEFRHLQERRAFGLNFERHTPEAVDLYGRPVRVGDKVRMLPPRGQTTSPDKRLWVVTGGGTVDGQRRADLRDPKTGDTANHPVEDLVVVAENTDVIYPGLVSTGKVERGGDKPYHTVINGENLHVLEALLYTHRGKVDAIYIDPPYNTGAKDWKYNNDYVESEDLYRHSKWLAFMERRLRVAKELLAPSDSMLVVTIDEKEYLRLGLLLEQVFPQAAIQMVSTVINRKGNARRGEFSRCEEYLFFVRVGGGVVTATGDNMLDEPSADVTEVRWKSLLRLASTGRTTGRFKLFYPIYFEEGSLRFVGAGDPIPDGVPMASVALPAGVTALWPISKDGSDGRWSIGRDKFLDYTRRGYVKFGRANGGGRTPYYLMESQVAAIESGDLVVVDRDPDGAVVLEAATSMKQPMSIWNRPSHSTSGPGTALLRQLLPDRRFPYPKSLYAVEDALRFCVGDKPNAVVIDFFAGSGTTAHALIRLNRQDGGRRSSVTVTNNEVGADEQASLRAQDLRPGDPDWEKWGICDYITKPRIRSAITGTCPDGSPVKGEYRFRDEFAMANGFMENAEFFTLTYEAPLTVSTNNAFERVAPLLWLRAGARGRRIESLAHGWDVADSYGVIERLDGLDQFVGALRAQPDASVAYIITDDDRRFQSACAVLPDHVEAVRLYESYLRNFQIDAVRSSR